MMTANGVDVLPYVVAHRFPPRHSARKHPLGPQTQRRIPSPRGLEPNQETILLHLGRTFLFSSMSDQMVDSSQLTTPAFPLLGSRNVQSGQTFCQWSIPCRNIRRPAAKEEDNHTEYTFLLWSFIFSLSIYPLGLLVLLLLSRGFSLHGLNRQYNLLTLRNSLRLLPCFGSDQRANHKNLNLFYISMWMWFPDKNIIMACLMSAATVLSLRSCKMFAIANWIYVFITRSEHSWKSCNKIRRFYLLVFFFYVAFSPAF
eukprot:284815389_1